MHLSATYKAAERRTKRAMRFISLPETNEVSPEEHCCSRRYLIYFTLLCIFGIVVLVFASFLPLLIVAEAGSLRNGFDLDRPAPCAEPAASCPYQQLSGVCMMLAQHCLLGVLDEGFALSSGRSLT